MNPTIFRPLNPNAPLPMTPNRPFRPTPQISKQLRLPIRPPGPLLQPPPSYNFISSVAPGMPYENILSYSGHFPAGSSAVRKNPALAPLLSEQPFIGSLNHSVDDWRHSSSFTPPLLASAPTSRPSESFNTIVADQISTMLGVIAVRSVVQSAYLPLDVSADRQQSPGVINHVQSNKRPWASLFKQVPRNAVIPLLQVQTGRKPTIHICSHSIFWLRDGSGIHRSECGECHCGD